VVISPGAMRTPHWHANANELTYCVSGTALVSVLDDGSQFSSFVVTAGDIGYRASVSAYSRKVLAATFNTHLAALPEFPFTPSDPLIVTRNNPVDARGVGESA
jgi:hypothetical protein